MRWWIVFLVACSQPASPPSKPPPPDDPPDEIAKPAGDAARKHPSFVWQHERDHYVRFDDATNPCREPNPDNPPDCPRSPSRIAGKILDSQIRDGAVEIAIDRGRRDSVDRGWTATILDERDRAISRPSSITRISEDESYASVAVGPDLVQANRHVLLERGR